MQTFEFVCLWLQISFYVHTAPGEEPSDERRLYCLFGKDSQFDKCKLTVCVGTCTAVCILEFRLFYELKSNLVLHSKVNNNQTAKQLVIKDPTAIEHTRSLTHNDRSLHDGCYKVGEIWAIETGSERENFIIKYVACFRCRTWVHFY